MKLLKRFTLPIVLLAMFMAVQPACASDISVTAANVVPASNAQIATGTAGATITAGETVYLDATTGSVKLADSATTLATATCIGVALNGASSGQPIQYQTGGDITIGATLTQGAVYVVSGANAGGIAPVADLTTGWYTVVIGVAKSTTVLTIINRGASTLTAHS